jgi:CMP-N,N'-diacetyllegionaminic acid synthase
MSVLAVIPARGGSKRLPGKNIKMLFDKPLIYWTIDFARSLTWVTEIEISTDSHEIVSACECYGISIDRLRPTTLATDEAGSVDVVLDLLGWLEGCGKTFEMVALLQPTTPIRYIERWNTAYNTLNKSDADAAVGVSLSEVHPYLHFKKKSNGYLDPWITNQSGVTRSQDYPFSCSVNGSLYLIKVDALKKERTFLPQKCVPIICADEVENIDIDTLLDWRIAEILISDWKNNK